MLMDRRNFMLGTLASGVMLGQSGSVAVAANVFTKPVPSSGERIPVVGLGSWGTFNVGNDSLLLDESAAVIRAFFDAGGRMIDSSPMYGSSQATIGYGLEKNNFPDEVFSADKVWISRAEDGPEQIEQSRVNWKIPKFDLLQVHNLVSWESHLETLQRMKSEGLLRYVGVTTSHGRRHSMLESIMESQPLDFVQLTYNPADREAEDRLLPLALEKGIAVIANRPFQRKRLLRRLDKVPLPDWAAEINASSWAQVVLKHISSHPAVTCSIPATSKVDHVRENLASASEPMPDMALRAKIEGVVESI